MTSLFEGSLFHCRINVVKSLANGEWDNEETKRICWFVSRHKNSNTTTFPPAPDVSKTVIVGKNAKSWVTNICQQRGINWLFNESLEIITIECMKILLRI